MHMNKLKYDYDNLLFDIGLLVDNINKYNRNLQSDLSIKKIYAIPRGGMIPGALLAMKLNIPFVKKCEIDKSTLIFDDVVDSGHTIRRLFDDIHPLTVPVAALHYKVCTPKAEMPTFCIACAVQQGTWIEYFWESEADEAPAEDAVIRLLQYIGEDVEREGLLETPKRVIKAYAQMFKGYNQKPEDIIKTFEEKDQKYDQIVLLKDIELHSHCEHHMLPFSGRAHVAYIPKKGVIGVSKLARLVDMYSHRLQIQERIGEQVTAALVRHLDPLAAACIIEAQHLCMTMRGVEKQKSKMVTSSLKGSFLTDSAAKMELLTLIMGRK